MTDLAWLSVAEGAQLLRTRKLSPIEWTKALLDRIALVDPAYNAFLVVTGDRALKEAKAAEAEIAAGKYRGPMHGVPYAAKDIFDVAGMATTCHSKIRKDHRATSDAFTIRKMSDAGAILVGKVALHEFATGGPAFDLPWPPARNPWNRDLHPGGSSSGSGAALAAGLVPAALGTDTGGSVRNPATCCGIVGLKPTYGALSLTGVFPLTYSLDHVGPMTRTVEDNAILLHALAGYDADDPTMSQRPVADCLKDMKAGIKGMKIGVIEHFYTEGLARRSRSGARHRERHRSAEEARRRRAHHQGVAAVAVDRLQPHHPRLPKPTRSTSATCRSGRRTSRCSPATASWPARSSRRRNTSRRSSCAARCASEMAEATRGLDAVITLSSLLLPCKIDDTPEVLKTYDQQCRLVFNVTGTPAISVPTGLSKSGMPLAMQIAAHAFDEPTVYRIAHAYCEAAAPSSPPIRRHSRDW